MESVELETKNLRELVTKFSHASWILVYYGYFYHCEKMMKLLWKDTLRGMIIHAILHNIWILFLMNLYSFYLDLIFHLVWTKNERAFKNSILSQLKTIEYRNQFDSDFCNYLLKIDQKYGRIPFKINVMLIERFSYDEFLTNFLSKYKYYFGNLLVFIWLDYIYLNADN